MLGLCIDINQAMCTIDAHAPLYWLHAELHTQYLANRLWEVLPCFAHACLSGVDVLGPAICDVCSPQVCLTDGISRYTVVECKQHAMLEWCSSLQSRNRERVFRSLSYIYCFTSKSTQIWSEFQLPTPLVTSGCTGKGFNVRFADFPCPLCYIQYLAAYCIFRAGAAVQLPVMKDHTRCRLKPSQGSPEWGYSYVL